MAAGSRSPRCSWWPSGSCRAASGCVARGSCSAPGGPCVLLGAGVTEGPAARCGSTRSRSMRARMCARAIDEAVVDDHAERLGEGVRFPAVSFRDGSRCCLADISTGSATLLGAPHGQVVWRSASSSTSWRPSGGCWLLCSVPGRPGPARWPWRCGRGRARRRSALGAPQDGCPAHQRSLLGATFSEQRW